MESTRQVRTVLLVDDDEATLRACKRQIESSGDRVVWTAQDLRAAFELAREHKPELAIVDLRLKTESGIDVTLGLKANHPDLVVAMFSCRMTWPAALRAQAAGATYVTEKSPSSCLAIVAAAEQGRPLPLPPDDTRTLEQVEWDHIIAVLEECSGNKMQAARRLGLHRQTLQKLLHKPPTGRTTTRWIELIAGDERDDQ